MAIGYSYIETELTYKGWSMVVNVILNCIKVLRYQTFFYLQANKKKQTYFCDELSIIIVKHRFYGLIGVMECSLKSLVINKLRKQHN